MIVRENLFQVRLDSKIVTDESLLITPRCALSKESQGSPGDLEGDLREV